MGNTKSINKYYGHVLRNSGTPFQQWVLSELPIPRVSVIKSSSVSPILAQDPIPLSGILHNELALEITPEREILLSDPGIYKVEYRMNVSTEAAGKVSVTMLTGGQEISRGISQTVEGPTDVITGEIYDFKIVKVTCCTGPVAISLVNSGATTITPILEGFTSIEMIITKL